MVNLILGEDIEHISIEELKSIMEGQKQAMEKVGLAIQKVTTE